MTERERLIELLKGGLMEHIGKSCNLAENLADHLLDKGVIVPPCKVGDTVWNEAILSILCAPYLVGCVTDDMYGMGINRGLDRAETEIDMLPTADVVPRSEVEKAVEYIEKHLRYQRKKVDIPFASREMRNYQRGAIDVIEYFEELVANLKKKYTEKGGNND